MQLDWIRIGSERPVRLVLDPRVTMVRAPAPELERLVAALSRAWLDAGGEVGGALSSAGIQVPLDDSTVLGLGLTGEGPPVVGAGWIPPPSAASVAAAGDAVMDAARRVDEARLALDLEERRREATRAAAEVGGRELDELRDRVAAIELQLAAADERAGVRRVERAAAGEAATLAAGRLQELDRLGELLREVVAASPSWRIGTAPTGLDELLEGCRSTGPGPTELLDALGAWSARMADGTAPVAAEAAALRDALASVERRWAEASVAGVEGDPEVRAALDTATAAGERTAALEELLDSGVPGERVRVEIDAAHERTLSAHHRDRDGAVAAEEEVLARYGFDSYLDYTIATSTRSVGDLVADRLGRLRDELAEAGAALAAARTRAAGRLDALAAEREPLQRRAAELLGGWPERPLDEVLGELPEPPAELRRLPEQVLAARTEAADERRRAEEAVADLDAEDRTAPAAREELVQAHATVSAGATELADLLEQVRSRADEELARCRDAAAVLARAEAQFVAAEGGADAAAYTDADLPDVLAAVLAALPSGAERPPLVLHDALRPLGPRLAMACLDALGRDAVQVLYLTDDDELLAAWEADPGRPPAVRLKDRGRLRRLLRRR
ncbi:MAG: hypothetical protein ACOYOP_06775 [Microthrixaceae bacterium]